MPRTVADRLLDIRETATDLRDFVAAMGTEMFHTLPHADRMGHRALKNALAKLGEAPKAIPDEIRGGHPGADWKGLARLGAMVAHQYSGIDTSRLLPVIRDELPALLAAVKIELQNSGGNDKQPAASEL